MIVLDASAAVQACLAAEGFELFGTEPLIAPALLWSEVSSALHEMRWRKEISARLADMAFGRLIAAPVSPRSSKRLRREAWPVAGSRFCRRSALLVGSDDRAVPITVPRA